MRMKTTFPPNIITSNLCMKNHSRKMLFKTTRSLQIFFRRKGESWLLKSRVRSLASLEFSCSEFFEEPAFVVHALVNSLESFDSLLLHFILKSKRNSLQSYARSYIIWSKPNFISWDLLFLQTGYLTFLEFFDSSLINPKDWAHLNFRMSDYEIIACLIGSWSSATHFFLD